MRSAIKVFIVAAVMLLGACGGGGGSDSASGSCAAFKIFNGDECTSDSLPVVKLIINGQGGCTGTIVTDSVVLTAAHCLIGARDIVAEHDRGVQSATAALANPLFGSGPRQLFDVAVVRFPNIANNLGVTPARFALSRPTQVGDQLKVVGYGLDGTPALVNGNPRGATVTVQGFKDGLITTLYDADNTGTCFGDSGGAATYNGGIVATVSGGGDFCGPGNVHVFAPLGVNGNYLFLQNALPGVALG